MLRLAPLALCLALLSPKSSAFDGGDMVGMMADMMRLWNVFTSLYDVDASFSIDGMPSWSNDYDSGYYPPQPAEYYAMPPSSWDGTWRSREGLTVQFRGNQFRLFAPGGNYMTGTFMLAGNRFVAHAAESNSLHIFYYEKRGSAFVLQEPDGGAIMFQRRRN